MQNCRPYQMCERRCRAPTLAEKRRNATYRPLSLLFLNRSALLVESMLSAVPIVEHPIVRHWLRHQKVCFANVLMRLGISWSKFPAWNFVVFPEPKERTHLSGNGWVICFLTRISILFFFFGISTYWLAIAIVGTSVVLTIQPNVDGSKKAVRLANRNGRR